MTAKRVGIRFCGGCNPTFERVALVEHLERARGQACVFVRHDAEALDALLVVCGCPTACAAEGMAPAGLPGLTVTSETDLDAVIRWIDDLDPGGGVP